MKWCRDRHRQEIHRDFQSSDIWLWQGVRVDKWKDLEQKWAKHFCDWFLQRVLLTFRQLIFTVMGVWHLSDGRPVWQEWVESCHIPVYLFDDTWQATATPTETMSSRQKTVEADCSVCESVITSSSNNSYFTPFLCVQYAEMAIYFFGKVENKTSFSINTDTPTVLSCVLPKQISANLNIMTELQLESHMLLLMVIPGSKLRCFLFEQHTSTTTE